MSTPLTVKQAFEGIIALGGEPRSLEAGLEACANLARAGLRALAASEGAPPVELLDDGLPTLEDAVKALVATTAFDQLRRRCRGHDDFDYPALKWLGEALGVEPQTISDVTRKLENDADLAEVISIVPAVKGEPSADVVEPWRALPSTAAGAAKAWDIITSDGDCVALVWGSPAFMETAEQRAREIVAAHNGRHRSGA